MERIEIEISEEAWAKLNAEAKRRGADANELAESLIVAAIEWAERERRARPN